MKPKGMSPIVKCLAMALTLLAVGGCAYRDALVLENGEKVDSLYYHESRMPDEVMVEMWIGRQDHREICRWRCAKEIRGNPVRNPVCAVAQVSSPVARGRAQRRAFARGRRIKHGAKFSKKVGARPCAPGANMRQYICSPELNSVATEVRTGALKAVGLKPMESR